MRRFLFLLPLAFSMFACAFAEDFLTLEGPEDLATDAFGTVAPPTSPAVTEPPNPGAVTPSPLPPSTPAATPPSDPTPLSLPADLPFTLDQADDATLALRADFAADVDLFPDATRYVIDVAVTFEPNGSATLTGRALIRYTNVADFALDDLVLMLWPNEPSQYLGRMTLDAVTIDGQPVEPETEKGGLVARLPLAAPLLPGGVIELETRFTTIAQPGLENGSRFGLTNGVLIAPTFYPLIPRIAAGGDWQTLPAGFPGDTTNSDTAFYAWRVTAPDDLVIVGSGSPIDVSRSGSLQSQTLVTGPMRDLALVVGDLEQTDNNAAGVDVNAYLLPEHANESGQVLAQAGTQMRTLTALVGPYPYNQLDIVDAPGAFGGIEYPGLILIGVIDDDGGYESAVIHEVGHQWFYGLIGDDQLLEPWLDEAAASYTEVLYAEAIGGPDAYADNIDFFRQYLDFADNPTLPIGLPADDYPGGDYYALVYGKGPLFFDALRRQLGDDTFFAFLQAYFAEYRYGFATSAGFQASAEAACACDLDELFNLWVYEGGPIE
jgi:hypothetical protein